MIEVEITKEIFEATKDLKVGKQICLCFLHPAEAELLKFLNELEYGTVLKLEVQDGLPVIGEAPFFICDEDIIKEKLKEKM